MSLNNIQILESDLSTPKSVVMANRKADRDLIQRIVDFSREMERNGFEVFKRWDNVIVTEKGWYFSIYDSDMEEVKKPPPPKPYKGQDGRMKVDLQGKDGIIYVEDVAIMVARGFHRNPDNYEYVKFKDGNPENCHADNLYWSETP